MKNILPKRYHLFAALGLIFLLLSLCTRLVFYVLSVSQIDFSVLGLGRVFLTGLFFDIGTLSFFLLPYALYLLLLPNRYNGSMLDKTLTRGAAFIVLLAFIFSTFSEFTFWEEFSSRFNFIAVDYLIYTNEVINNINESYPLPILLSIVFLMVGLIFLLLHKKKIFKNTFHNAISFKQKVIGLGVTAFVALFFFSFVTNKHAEWSDNRYENELSKTGIYSFFAAFRNNELSYTDFYLTQDLDTSMSVLQKNVLQKNDELLIPKKYSLKRQVNNEGEERTPNVIFICIESLSADFMARYGNTRGVTPFLDSLAKQSLVFDQLYATGTRTVRGMEAITLSIPPSPGRSIVKRKNNTNFFNVGTVFKQKGYKNVFFYGGDGYFDNMNQFFGGNGFDIVDRGRGYLMGDEFHSKRTNIEDEEVTFENAWGVCDEDIYSKVIKEADLNHQNKQPFFNFIMTTSNHRPYTYPENKIDVPSGAGRHGAVKYTDYALQQFITNAQKKPWFSNTIFVIMADHCASSAGKREIDVSKYHIPGMVYNLPQQDPKTIAVTCSQIDVFPTLFGCFNWTYPSQLIGKDLAKMKPNEGRALIGNYRNLGLLQHQKLMILSDKKGADLFLWDKTSNTLTPTSVDPIFLKNTIAYYHANDYFYKNNFYKNTVQGE